MIPGQKSKVRKVAVEAVSAEYEKFVMQTSYKVVSGKPYYGAWSKRKTVRVK